MPPGLFESTTIDCWACMEKAKAAIASLSVQYRIPEELAASALGPERVPAPVPQLILHELLQGLFAGKSAEHVAVFVSRDAFRHVGLRPFLGDEGRHLAVFDAADPDALPERRIEFLARLRIGGVENVVAVDVEAARPAELPPFGEKFSILVEDLDAVVGAVGDEQPPARIHGESMRHVEFALSLARFAPGLDEFTVLGELHDARVRLLAMSVGDEDVAIGRDQDIGRSIEGVGPIARDAGLAQRHQHLSVGTKLDDRVALAVAASAVGHPDVAIPVREQAVWPIDHAAAEARHPLAGGVELVDRRESRALAGLCAAAMVDPNAGAS